MLDTSKIYTTKRNGDLRILNYTNHKKIEVEFIGTGFTTTTRSYLIIQGNVRDQLKPSVNGIGFIGVGEYTSTIKGRHAKSYKIWKGVLDRCYNPKSLKTHPAYKGCSVDIEWHNYQNFAKWFESNYIDGFHIDKDIKVKGNKVYSADNCMFVSKSQNTIEAKAKHYRFISPNGELVDIYNMAQFCRDNNLIGTSMSLVSLGRKSEHKGWKIK